MAKVPHPCFDPCSMEVDTDDSKVGPRLDPAGGITCGPNGLRAEFPATSFITPIHAAGASVPLTGQQIATNVGVYRPASGAISTVIDGGLSIGNPFPGQALIQISAISERFIYSDPTPDEFSDATAALAVSPDGNIGYQDAQRIYVFCNGGGGLAAMGHGAGSFLCGWLVPPGWSGRPKFVFTNFNRNGQPGNIIRAGTILWRYTLQRAT